MLTFPGGYSFTNNEIFTLTQNAKRKWRTQQKGTFNASTMETHKAGKPRMNRIARRSAGGALSAKCITFVCKFIYVKIIGVAHVLTSI